MTANREEDLETWFVNNIALLRNSAGAAPPATVECHRYALKWLETAHEKFAELRVEPKTPPPTRIVPKPPPAVDPPRRKVPKVTKTAHAR
jgi:hypothetical protein